MKKLILILFLTFNLSVSFSQVTYTWNGSSSTDWNTASNWTPAGTPTATDHVIIVTGANNCNLSSDVIVNNLTMNSGTLNVGTHNLTINGNATFNLGTVNGTGSIHCNGANTVFGTTASGPTIHPNVVANTLSIRSQRTTYYGTVNFTKTPGATAIDSCRGGNTFHSTFTLTNASDDVTGSNGDIYLGANNGDPTDVFHGRAIFNLTGAARIRIPQNGTAIFNGVVELIAAGFGDTHDRIHLARQGSASVTFNDTVYAIISSNTSDFQFALDAGTSCIFNGPLVCNRLAGANAAEFSIGTNGNISFNHNVILNNNSTGSITITNGTGVATLANGRTFSVGTDGFNSGTLDIRNLTQIGSTNQNLTFGTSAFLFIQNCTFNANTVNFSSGRIYTRSTNYNGTSLILTKTGAGNDSNGANYFNGSVIINNTSNSEFWFSGSFAADVFNSTVEINNSGTGVIAMSRNYNTSYPENITVTNTSTIAGGGIIFGFAGATSTLAATKTISVGPAGYQNGYLTLYRFNQLGTTPQTLNLSGVNTNLRLGNPLNITFGCNFGGDFIGSASIIDLIGNVFAGTTIFNQTGNGGDRLWGGNTFHGAHTINVSGTGGNILCSRAFAAETYLSTVTVNLTNSGNVTLSSNFNTNYPENITLTSTSTGSVGFGLNGGSSTLANGKTISIGALGYTGNFLRLYNFTQVGPTPQTLNLTGTTSQIELGSPTNISYGSTFNGDLTINAVNFVITSSIFNGNCNFTKSGAGGNNTSNGNNTFNSNLTFTNNCTNNNIYVGMSNIFGPDTYNGVVNLSTSCNGGGFIMARIFDGNFNHNIICNSTNNGNIYFGVGSNHPGIAILASNRTITCGTFNSGILGFRRFQQLSNTPQTITTTGTGNVEFGSTIASGITNTFTSWEGDVNVSSGGYTAINNSTFQRNFTSVARNYVNFVNSAYNITTGNTSLSRVAGTTNDLLGGNNIIHGNFTFSNTGSGIFRTGVAPYGGDTFNGNVTINNSGTATVSFSFNNGVNTIAGNLDISNLSTGSVRFGESATTNSTTIAGTITSAPGNFTNGTISLRYLTQNGGANAITGTAGVVSLTIDNSTLNGNLAITNVGTTTLSSSTFNGTVTNNNSGTSSLLTSTFNGNVNVNNTASTTLRSSTYNALSNFTSGSFVLGGTLAQGNTFNANANFTKTGNTNDYINGGNIFNFPTTFTTNNTSGQWRLGSSAPDDFNSDVVFTQNAAGLLLPAYEFNSTFAGNITVAGGSGIAITFGSNNGRVIMDGSNPQFINRTSGDIPNFIRITINKPSNNVTLNTPINVRLNLDLINRHINSDNTNLLIMLAGSNVTSVSDASFVNGPVRKIGNTAFTFPTGKEGNYYGMHFYSAYRPISISAPTNTTHHFTAEYFMQDPHPTYNHGSLGAGISHISNCEYWILDRTNGNSNVNVTLSYKDFAPAVNCSGVNNQGDLLVARWNGTQWVSHGNGGTTGTINNGTVVTSAPVTAFSPFTLASSNSATNPLPIELLSFTAEKNEKSVLLKWTTATEINNDYFELEKSKDGINFETFAKIKGAGFSNQTIDYSHIDINPYRGLSYYRLKQVDFDGTYYYSDIIAVNFNLMEQKLQFYPNPASQIINIENLNSNSNYIINIYDITGKLIISKNTAQTNTFTLSINELVSGFYTLQVLSENQTIFLDKLIKE